MRTLTSASLALTAILLHTSPLHGQERSDPPPEGALDPNEEEARALFRAGVQAMDGGEYARAAEAFRAAYALTPHPDLQYNIYSALERLGDLEAAATALEHYLADGEMDDARRLTMQSRLSRLRERIAQARAQALEAEVARQREASATPAQAASGAAYTPLVWA